MDLKAQRSGLKDDASKHILIDATIKNSHERQVTPSACVLGGHRFDRRTITKLTQLVGDNLDSKPEMLSRNKIFLRVRKTYQEFTSNKKSFGVSGDENDDIETSVLNLVTVCTKVRSQNCLL